MAPTDPERSARPGPDTDATLVRPAERTGDAHPTLSAGPARPSPPAAPPARAPRADGRRPPDAVGGPSRLIPPGVRPGPDPRAPDRAGADVTPGDRRGGPRIRHRGGARPRRDGHRVQGDPGRAQPPRRPEDA